MALAKALINRPEVLLLDEPTASLTPHETDALLAILRRLRDQGVAIAFVSHKLEEVLALCDTVTVLRDGGRVCGGEPLAGKTRADLVRLMVGREETRAAHSAAAGPRGNPALELRGVATASGHRGIDLILHEREVLGLYGLVGAGRSELARAIIGMDRITGGEMRVRGELARIGSVAEALHRHGIGYVSEDRKQEGLILLHGVRANAGITLWRRLSRWRVWLRDGAIGRAVLPVLHQLDVRMASLDTPVGTLSGGNQQKVSLAKWLAARSRILIIDEPTVGIDVRTKAYFHGLIRDLAANGAAVLVISSDMPELIALADRIAVMHASRMVGDFDNSRDYAAMSQAIMDRIHASP